MLLSENNHLSFNILVYIFQVPLNQILVFSHFFMSPFDFCTYFALYTALWSYTNSRLMLFVAQTTFS